MGKVSESIFDGKKHIIPMADVSHVEKHWYKGEQMTQENLKGYLVIMKQTTWNGELDCYNNNPYLCKDEGEEFLKAWKMYRHELEIETIAADNFNGIDPIPGTMESLGRLKL
jgi:hypothetical protein